MQKARYYADWLFKDLRGRRGKYIIAEVPNLPLVVFMISVVLGVILYPGFWQTLFQIIAFASLTIWSLGEYRGGHSRFRKLLGILGLASVLIVFVLWLT